METKSNKLEDFERKEPVWDLEGTTPSNNAGGMENKEAVLEGATTKTFAQLDSYKQVKLSFEGMPMDGPARPFTAFKLQRQEAAIFNETGASEHILRTRETFSMTDKGWKENIENPELVEALAEDTKMQKSILDAEKPAFLKDAVDKIRERDELLKMEKASQTGPVAAPETNPSLAVEKVPLSREVVAERMEKSVERSRERVEGVENKLSARREASKARLEEAGLTNVEKGMKSLNSMSPKTKFLIAIGFAGAAVISGGATTVLSKIFSAGTFATGLYEKEVAQKQKDGAPIKRGRIILKSLLVGAVLALGTSQLMSLVADAASPIVSDTIDKVKEFFAGSPDVAAVPEIGAAEPVIPPLEQVALPEYTVEQGDTLTKVAMEKVMPSLPGIENLSDFQKENMIQNMLKYAAANPADPDFATINKFANPDLIKPNDVLDLNQIKEALSKFNYMKFGGDTLLDRAGKL